MTVLIIDPGDSDVYAFDWTDVLGGATLSAVVHSVPSPLSILSETTDGANKRSLVKITGAVHGQTYLIEGSATLSSGEIVNRQFPLRCFNG